jgi:HK97 family phage major capsid protein
MTNEEVEMLGKIKEQTETMVKAQGFSKKEEVELIVKDHMKTFEGLDIESLKALTGDKGVMKIVQALGAEVTALKEKGASHEEVSMKDEIKAWTEKNADTLNKIKGGTKADLPEFNVKVSTLTTANVNTQGSAYLPQPGFESGLHDLRRIQATFWDYLPKGSTSNASWTWVNKKQPTGAADWIGQGVAKPGVAFELTTEVSNAKKIAVSLKASTEILQDIQGMESFIRGELNYQFRKIINNKLLTGAATSAYPAGITTIAVPFSTTGLETDNPNNYDAIMACITQLRVQYFDLPVTVFVNPVDFANMQMGKATTSGVYLMPPFSAAGGMNVGGATVVADSNISAGYILAACLDLYKILIYRPATVSLGWENDDFTKNLITFIEEMRLHQYVSDNDRGAFIYDTFTRVKAFMVAS